MSQKERDKRYYESLKEKGLCLMCRQELDRQGVYCTSCLGKRNAEQRKTRAFYKKNHICPSCGKNILYGDEKICIDCKAKRYIRYHQKAEPLTNEEKTKMREYNHSIYNERKERGICVRCGKYKAVRNRVRCVICLKRDMEEHHKRER